MAHRIFVERAGSIVNRAHLDHEYPYRYACDPHRYEAHKRAQRHKRDAQNAILVGLIEYNNSYSDELS